jgi:protein-disulfide isomerase
VVLAHQMSMENPLVQAEMIEANEFFELARRYNVTGVPQTTINDGEGVVLGAVPEEHLLQEIKRAVHA